MEKIETNMYVRTTKGSIGKVQKIDYRSNENDNNLRNIDCIHFDNCIDEISEKIYSPCFYIFEDAIADYNIINITKEEDLCIIEFYSPKYHRRIKELFEISYKENQTICFQNASITMYIFNNIWSNKVAKLKPIIKKILTREQFEAIIYKVGE